MPIEADTGAGYGSDPVSSGPYAITSVDPATGILLDRNPQWDPATDDVRTALPDQVVVRTGLSGVERDQALLAGSADVDITGTGVQAATTARLAADEDNPVRDRVDDVTTGAVRLLALPTDVAPMDNADCRAAVAAVIDRRAVQERTRRRRSTWCAAPSCGRGRSTAARRIPTPAPTSTPHARRWRPAGSPTASPPCWPWPTRRAASTSPTRSPASSAEVGIRGRRSGR